MVRTNSNQVAGANTSVIGGGKDNKIDVDFSGRSANFSTIGGGEENTVLPSIDPTSSITGHSTIAGGYGNVVSGTSATVAGGNSNIAEGVNSWIPGGSNALAHYMVRDLMLLVTFLNRVMLNIIG